MTSTEELDSGGDSGANQNHDHVVSPSFDATDQIY